MKLFQRKPKPQPEQETVKTVEPEQYRCCFCGEKFSVSEPEHLHTFTNGDLYLKRLPYNYLCEGCYAEREKARSHHNVANKNTVLEHPAIKQRKSNKIRLVREA